MIKERAQVLPGDIRTFTVICDDCEEELPPRGSEHIAYAIAIDQGWKIRVRERRFSGVSTCDYCPKCKGRH